MSKLISLFLAIFLFQSCSEWYDILPEELDETITPEQLELNMGIEITQLRIDLVRMVKEQEATTDDANENGESVVVNQDYHHIGFFLNNIVFADLNDNVSLSVLQLFNIQPDEDYEIENRIHGLLSDYVVSVKREGNITTGKESGLLTPRLFKAEQLADGISMDHREMFPYRTYYISDDRISERVRGLFIDLFFVRIQKNDKQFIAPSNLCEKAYSQPEPNKILLANKNCKVYRTDQYLEIKSSLSGTIKLYTLSDGFIIDSKYGSKRTVKITDSQIELIEFGRVTETFKLIY